MEEKITDLCEIEVELYLDYYNGEYGFSEFNQKLDSNQNKIINLVYDLLEDGFDEEKILSEIKSLGAYYKKTPEFFGKDNDTSMYPSGYFETNKNKKYPFHEKCGYTLSLVKRFFKTRKYIKAELSLRDKIEEEGIRKMILSHMRGMKKKNTKRRKNKSKRKRSRKTKKN
tara:strand:- start:2234 stop:2743 length:510 start_codon:yes stop_codon:yes gene_type:complete